jgi:hypothetical protein
MANQHKAPAEKDEALLREKRRADFFEQVATLRFTSCRNFFLGSGESHWENPRNGWSTWFVEYG